LPAALENTHLPYMAAFPMNTSNCHYPSPCPYLFVCQTEENPLRLDGPPHELVIDEWNPIRELKEKPDEGEKSA